MMLTVGQQARAGVERVYELIDTEPQMNERPTRTSCPPTPTASVEFDDVAFGYTAERPVLDGFGLRVEPGETVAVVGVQRQRQVHGLPAAAPLLRRDRRRGTGRRARTCAS